MKTTIKVDNISVYSSIQNNTVKNIKDSVIILKFIYWSAIIAKNIGISLIVASSSSKSISNISWSN